MYLYRTAYRTLQRMALLLMSALLATAASAQASCNPGSAWQCVGAFEMRWTHKAGPERVRMTKFRNGEFMAEFEHRGVRKQYLVAEPSGLELYAGPADAEPPELGQNPLPLLELAFAVPATALQTAYPFGPESVPRRSSQVEIELDRGAKRTATLSTNRLSASRIAFRLVMRDGRNAPIEGLWDGELQEPLPDHFPLKLWNHASGLSVESLQEARMFQWETPED
jgi:hypothetical protein